MKIRPQIQLRFRDEAQHDVVRRLSESAGLSVNEWIIRVIEAEAEKRPKTRKRA